MANRERTFVLDVGARYGMHPSWSRFRGDLRYLMLEPDREEAERLRARLDPGVFEVLPVAVDAREGRRTFHLLKHRGLSSFLRPDLESECFRRLKPGQAEIERTVEIDTVTTDALMRSRGIRLDFLKVDTEGTEHDVLVGATQQLETSVLGVRSSCNFQPCFHGQRLFSESHDFLRARGFELLNLDYRGYGYPRLGLFRKPDPIEPEDFRYGVLVAADAVWLKRPERIALACGEDREALAFAVLKAAAFCLLNHAPDVGIDLLREHARGSLGGWGESVTRSRLFKVVRLDVAHFLGRWRTVPDEQWERVRGYFQDIFAETLAGGSDFYPQVQAWASDH